MKSNPYYLIPLLLILAAGSVRAADDPDDAARDKKVQAILDKRHAEIRYVGEKFSDVVENLREISGADITVNWKAVEAAGIDKSTPVKTRLRDIKLSKALSVILSDLGGGKVDLKYTVEDGVITISTAGQLATKTMVVVYNVPDLLIGGKVAPPRQPTSRPARNDGKAAGLIQTIMTSVDPDSWIDNGGKSGQIKHLNGSLVVTQTKENHEKIVALLKKLRAGNE